METLTLSKPFKLQNDKEITEFQLNFDDLSTADFRQITQLEAQISDPKRISGESMAKPKSLSFEFQLASGFLAAIKGTQGLLIDDFIRIPMADALEIAQTARFFWLDVD